DSWCVLHDISLFADTKFQNALACRYLFTAVVSDEKISPVSDYPGRPANIGAFRVSNVTMKYAGNLFGNLFIPWGTGVLDKDFGDMKKVITKYYAPEQYDAFCEAFAFQKDLMKRRKEDRFSVWLNHKVWSFKRLAKRACPSLYYWLKRHLKKD
ncbi:MAG: hypothetical protein II877_04560, partial [Synergistaceae bacterium]|nr:hypothetical protein [Synergistaceae bacterium]